MAAGLLCDCDRVPYSDGGSCLEVAKRWRRGRHFAGPTFPRDKDSHALEHFGWGACSFGQEGVGTASAIVRGDTARDDHGRQSWMEFLGAADEFIAVHLRHDQVAEQKIE